MQLLFYSSEVDQDNKRLDAAVHKVIPAGRIEISKARTPEGEAPDDQ